MKVLELKEKAKSLGIKGYYKMKKQQLLDAILYAETHDEYDDPIILNIDPIIKPDIKPDINYTVVLKRNGETLEIPVDSVDEFFRTAKSYKRFPLVELYASNKKIRQLRQ